MKVFCGKCKHYGYAMKRAENTCCAPDNYEDSYAYPKCTRILRPETKNKDNDCASFRVRSFWKFWE